MVKESIRKGGEYYLRFFNEDGLSYWRYPNFWPVDIHNQAQGIITTGKLSLIWPEYFETHDKILNITISKMQSQRGFFYRRLYPRFKDKIQYMRWSQAWMLLALSNSLEIRKEVA